MKINTLDEFINIIIADQKEPITVFSNSTHHAFAERIINRIVGKFPEYYEIAYFVGNYNLQKWCRKKRAEMKLDLNSLNHAIVENSDYFGLKTHNDMHLQKETLSITDKIINKIDEVVKNIKNDGYTSGERRALMDLLCEEDSSKFIFCTHFETGIERLFTLYYKEFKQYSEDIEKIKSQIDDDIYLAFHNADNLIYVLAKTSKNDLIFDSDVSFDTAYTLVSEAIDSLNGYPYTVDLYRVLKLYLKGEKETCIARRINKSRTYVRTRYEEGLKVIEALIWGFV